jgi:hypothetical protein
VQGLARLLPAVLDRTGCLVIDITEDSPESPPPKLLPTPEELSCENSFERLSDDMEQRIYQPTKCDCGGKVLQSQDVQNCSTGISTQQSFTAEMEDQSASTGLQGRLVLPSHNFEPALARPVSAASGWAGCPIIDITMESQDAPPPSALLVQAVVTIDLTLEMDPTGGGGGKRRKVA